MLKRILWFMLALPAGALLVTLAVANRHPVRMAFNPFRPEDVRLSIEMPLFGYLLGALIAGVVIGGFAAWLGQSRWRRTARNRTQEAHRWRAEADRLANERDAGVETSRGRQLAVARR